MREENDLSAHILSSLHGAAYSSILHAARHTAFAILPSPLAARGSGQLPETPFAHKRKAAVPSTTTTPNVALQRFKAALPRTSFVLLAFNYTALARHRVPVPAYLADDGTPAHGMKVDRACGSRVCWSWVARAVKRQGNFLLPSQPRVVRASGGEDSVSAVYLARVGLRDVALQREASDPYARSRCCVWYLVLRI